MGLELNEFVFDEFKVSFPGKQLVRNIMELQLQQIDSIEMYGLIVCCVYNPVRGVI